MNCNRNQMIFKMKTYKTSKSLAINSNKYLKFKMILYIIKVYKKSIKILLII